MPHHRHSRHSSTCGDGCSQPGQKDNDHDSDNDSKEEEEEAEDADCEAGTSGHHRHHRSHHQSTNASDPATMYAANASPEPPRMFGTPGPGTYDMPSCFMSSERILNAAGYVLASNVGATIKGRNFPPTDGPFANGCSPGPQAYSPRACAASSSPRASRTVFGSARRVQQAKLYMGSEQMNTAAAQTSEGPGPGMYRVGRGRVPGRQAPGPANAPRATFAPPRSAPQSLQRLCSSLGLSLSFNALHTTSQQQQQQQNGKSFGFHSSSNSPRRGYAASNLAVNATWDSSGSGDANTATSSSGGSAGSGADAAAGAASSAVAGRVAASATNGGRKWSFGPPGGLQKGMERRRSKEGNVFISPQHAVVDPGPLMASATPGAAAYSVDGKLQVLSTHKSSGRAGFGSEKKAVEFTAKLYLSSEHVRSDPALSCSPGPGTASCSLPGCVGGAHGGPRFGSPPRSPLAKQPFISKQHEILNAGADSPGPACYDAAAAALAGTALGDRRTAHFGSGEREVSSKVKRTFAPGPGAYRTDVVKLSTHAHSPAFSLGASHGSGSSLVPTSSCQTPGVGAYSIALADSQCLPNQSGAVTIKGKLQQGGIMGPSWGPGPAAYSPMQGMGAEADHAWQNRWGSSSKDTGSSHTQPASAVAETQQQRQEGRMQQSLGSRGVLEQQLPNPSRSFKLNLPAAADFVSSSRSSISSGYRSSLSSVPKAGSSCKDADETRSAAAVAADGGSAAGGSSPRMASRAGGGSSPRRRGFTIQGKDNCPARSGIHRESPGPAAYDVNDTPTVPYGGTCKINSRTSPRRMYISKLHAESQAGVDSPGPAAYSSSSSNFKALSKHVHGGAFSFGTGSRPEMAKIRF